MEFVFFGMIVLGIAVATYIAVGTTLGEMATHNMSLAQLRHPYARKWRKRPVVAIVTSPGNPAPKIGYRRSIMAHTRDVAADLFVFVPHGMRVDTPTLLQAVLSLNANPARQSVAVLPTPQQPTTLRDLLQQYCTILGTPFAQATSGLGIATPQRHMVVAVTHATKKDSVYFAVRLLLAIINGVIIGYAFYAAVVLQRPELMLTYLAGFTLWAAWAIGSYPRIRMPQKVAYFALLPTAVPYLLWRVLVQPFTIVKNR